MGNSFEKASSWDDKPRKIQLIEKGCKIIAHKISFNKTNKVLDYGCSFGFGLSNN